MQKRKQVSHDNDDRLGVGGDGDFELSHSFCLPLDFWGKQAMKGSDLPSYTLIPYITLLTGMLQELAVALAGKERLLQSSEVELQHSSDRIQVIRTLREGILSYEGNKQPTDQYRGGWCRDSNTYSATSFECISKVIDLQLRTRHPKYPFMVKTWKTDMIVCPFCQMNFLNCASLCPHVHTLTIQVDKAHTTLHNDWNLLSWCLNKNTRGH